MRFDEDDVLVEEELSDVTVEDLLGSRLVVYNDDYNSFEHVIDCFCKYLKHTPEQAEQCALIIHTKGKASVKEGTVEELEPYKVALTDAGLNAKIE
jgi:ATP-dependent Clp protease adaptor protein ClpS